MLDSIKLEHFRNLVSLAGADGVIQKSERIALSKIAYESGIPFDRMNVMINKSDEYVYLIPQNVKERDKQMCDMISLALVDGELAKVELDLIMTVGQKLGFTSDEIKKQIKDQLDNL
ncbi:MAG: hypothetical protein OEW67_05320 [Cyclobacteriaceae bacterium]|nr:hypothetical protein [Cyclobacteriaceae bacterium]